MALLMLALTITPAEVWDHPVSDTTYRGFDPNLIYTSSGGSGSIHVSSDSIDITAPTGSDPSINLATTPLKRFDAAVDVTVQQNSGARVPFRLGLWSPWTSSGFFVLFASAPQNLITAVTLAPNSPGVPLVGPDVPRQTVLGNYKLGSSYRVRFLLDKASRSLTAHVSSSDGGSAAALMDSQLSPNLLGDVPLSLSASASAGEGSSRVVLRNYRVGLPHERLWASKIADSRAQTALIGLAVLGLLLLGISIAFRFGAGLDLVAKIRAAYAGLRRRLATDLRVIVLLAGAVAVYLVGNAWLFPLGGHPFDMAAEKLYAYVARTYGPDQLYYLPNIVTLPKIWHGVPIQEIPFPYEPGAAYLFTAIGWVNSVLTGGGPFSLDSVHLEYLIKAVNVLFGLGDAALIYWILRQVGAGYRWSLAAGGLWLFNPAVWFSMSVWGQTHVISLFFVLVAVLMAEKHRPLWAWLALSAACLTRPQMLVFGLLLGVLFLRKFSWKQNVVALSWTVILTFLALLPFTLATSPSLPVDIMLNTFRVQEGGANGSVVTAVSQDTYSVWPLVEYLTQGVSGLHQVFNPKVGIVSGSLTYLGLSQILTLGALLVVAGALLVQRRVTNDGGAYLPLVALGITAFLMLLFGLVATHFLLALPFLLLSRRWIGNAAYFYVVVIWTLTTFVTMFGDMGLVLTALDYPLLAPANNAITRFFVWLYTGDRFITVGIVANICVVIWLGVLTLRSPRPLRTPLSA